MNGHSSVARPARTYLHQLCVDTECRLEDLSGVISERERYCQGTLYFQRDWMMKMINIGIFLQLFTSYLFSRCYVRLSAGEVENTDCREARSPTTNNNNCPVMTQNNLMVFIR